MAWNDGLAGTARDIAATTNTPLRVMAGPGTGKSFAMKRRVARLLEAGQNARRILTVTFTRNAAASLVEDLRALGTPNCENVRAGTLHAFCFALLSKEDVFAYLGRKPRPLVTFSKSGVLQFEANAMLADLVILGCSQGLIPFEKPDELPQEQVAILQEQRRLFYVALTRCTEVLVVSSATQMARDFAWKIGARVAPGRSQYARTVASQFLDELGPQAPPAVHGNNWAY